MNHGRAVGKSLSHSRRDGGGWSGLAARRAHRAAGRGLPAEPPPANPVAAPRVRRPIPDLRNRRAGEIVPDVGIPHLEPVAIVFETADPQVGAAVGPALGRGSPTVPKGVSFCSLIEQQVLRLPEQSRALSARLATPRAPPSPRRRSRGGRRPSTTRRPPDARRGCGRSRGTTRRGGSPGRGSRARRSTCAGRPG